MKGKVFSFVYLVSLVMLICSSPVYAGVDNCDGTSTADNGLMWQSCKMGDIYHEPAGSWWGHCYPSDLWFNWSRAQDVCSSLVLGEHSDWRLPNITELISDPFYARYLNWRAESKSVSITTQYPDHVYYLDGVDHTVEFTVKVDWAGLEPQKVRFETPNGTHDVLASGDTVTKEFNMGGREL